MRLASCSSLNFFCENPRTKVLSMHFLKLPTSGNNDPEKGETPILTMDNTELSHWGTRYSWYVVFVLYNTNTTYQLYLVPQWLSSVLSIVRMGVSPFSGSLLPEVGSFKKCIDKTLVLGFSQKKFKELQLANRTGLNFSSSELLVQLTP